MSQTAAPPTFTALPATEKKRAKGPAFGEFGSRASEVKLAHTYQFVFGLIDALVLEEPKHARYALVAQELVLTATGVLVSVKPTANRPGAFLVPWAQIEYVLLLVEAPEPAADKAA